MDTESTKSTESTEIKIHSGNLAVTPKAKAAPKAKPVVMKPILKAKAAPKAKVTAKPASKSLAVKVKVKGKTVVGHALKTDLKTAKAAPKAKGARKFGVESVVTIEKLTALLKSKPHTAAELAKVFKRSTIAVKRQVAKVPRVKCEPRAANGKIGRRPNVYSLA